MCTKHIWTGVRVKGQRDIYIKPPMKPTSMKQNIILLLTYFSIFYAKWKSGMPPVHLRYIISMASDEGIFLNVMWRSCQRSHLKAMTSNLHLQQHQHGTHTQFWVRETSSSTQCRNTGYFLPHNDMTVQKQMIGSYTF